MPEAPRVFISYSHDGAAHKARVLDLANRLRDGGVDAIIDQHYPFPAEGWPLWCEKQIGEAGCVVMVCTATYHRRVRNEEVSGTGHGVLHEAHIIRQKLYDGGGVSTKFVPVYYSDGSRLDVPEIVRRFSHYAVDTEQGFSDLYRLLTDQPATPPGPLGARIEMPPEPRPGLESEGLAGGGAAPVPAAPPTQADRLFVGREGELSALAALLLPAGGQRRPVVVAGMPGVGKSYLIDRCFAGHAVSFPGGYVRVSLDAEAPPVLNDLLAQIAGRLKLPTGDAARLAARLAAPASLLHVENIDGKQAGRVAAALAAVLPGCALVFSARHQGLGTAAGWGQVLLEPFADAEALDQLRAELGAGAPHQDAWPELAAALGRLPLALHLAAGHLRAGDPPAKFLARLRTRGLTLDYVDPADPVFLQRSRALLTEAFDSSLALLRRDGGADGAAWVDGLHALGWGAAADFGESLGAAVAGLEPEAFDEMARAAAALSLLERRPGEKGVRLRLHPLLAELGRARGPRDEAVARMTGWFCARLPKPGAGEAWRWNEVHAEIASLIEWLPQVPAEERVAVERAGSQFAIACGPYEAWQHFCEKMLAGQLSEEQQSNALWTLAAVARDAGQPDRALATAQKKRDIDFSRGADREAALALGLIADIHFAEGKFQEAWRISAEEQLPIYIRLEDIREQIVTRSRMADVLQKRGQLDQAFNIRKYLPLSRLQDDRLSAIMLTRIADLQRERGELDDVFEIFSQNVLPIFEKLGDERAVAVTKARIAELQERGKEYDVLVQENLRLELFEKVGDAREMALTWAKIGNERARRNEVDTAISIYEQHVLPRLLDSRHLSDLVVARWYLACHLLRRAATGDCTKAGRQLCTALSEARRMQLASVNQIEETLQRHGLSCD